MTTKLKAETLMELKAAIELAIEEFGPDGKWHGFDDESLYVYADTRPKAPSTWYEILNKDSKERLLKAIK